MSAAHQSEIPVPVPFVGDGPPRLMDATAFTAQPAVEPPKHVQRIYHGQRIRVVRSICLNAACQRVWQGTYGTAGPKLCPSCLSDVWSEEMPDGG